MQIEGILKNVKRWATGKDASSRAGEEATKMMNAQASNSKEKANKYFNRYKKLNKLATEEVDKKDTVTLDIPLMIRVLELAREDIKSDMDLHRVVERLIDIRNKGVLTMDDYDFIANMKEDIDLGFDYELVEEQSLNVKEDIYQDPHAATQTVFDGGNNPDDTSPVKRQLSKSARMIKSLYKHNNMKEELNDWEKEDKSVASPGKKSKIQNMDQKVGLGEKPKAAAIMSGGKTLTGTTRDDVEIDPVMKQRPGANPDKMNQQNQQKV